MAKRSGVTKADIEKHARALGLEWDVHGSHDWSHVAVYLDMVEQGLIPGVCVLDGKITDTPSQERVGNETRAEYYDSVRQMAQELVDETYDEDEDELDRDRFDEQLHQSVDGSHYIIYTHANLAVLVFSSNWLAIDEVYSDMGESLEGRTATLTTVIGQAAFFAMEADVREAVEGILEERRENRSDEDE